MSRRYLAPSDHGMSAINLKATGIVASTEIWDADEIFSVTASMAIVITGTSSAGSASWLVDVFKDPLGATLVHTITAVTAIDLTGTDTTTYAVFTFGGTGSGASNGTKSSAADALKDFPFFRIRLNRNVAANGTTVTGNVTMLATGWKRALD